MSLTNKRGIPWQPNRFRKAWGDATRKAKIEDRTFHDLRGTAVTRLAEAECSAAEIAAITGHSMRDVGAILDNYLARTARWRSPPSPSWSEARSENVRATILQNGLQNAGRHFR